MRPHRARHHQTLIVLALVLSGAAGHVSAHDFWVGPSAFRPKVGALVGVRLLVGENMIGDPVPRDPAIIKQFVVATATGTKPVPGRDGGDPAGVMRVDAPGLLVVGYQSHPRTIELTPDTFERYLGEEGLDEVRALVADAPGRKTAREMFSRCAKALLSPDGSPDSGRDRSLGLTLELVAERNPYAIGAGQELPFVLTYDQKPRAGALVIAISQRDPARKLTARTDRQGRVVFALPVGGAWIVKAVHMVAARPGSGVDWESFWASSTFEVPDGARPAAPR